MEQKFELVYEILQKIQTHFVRKQLNMQILHHFQKRTLVGLVRFSVSSRAGLLNLKSNGYSEVWSSWLKHKQNVLFTRQNMQTLNFWKFIQIGDPGLRNFVEFLDSSRSIRLLRIKQKSEILIRSDSKILKKFAFCAKKNIFAIFVSVRLRPSRSFVGFWTVQGPDFLKHQA